MTKAPPNMLINVQTYNNGGARHIDMGRVLHAVAVDPPASLSVVELTVPCARSAISSSQVDHERESSRDMLMRVAQRDALCANCSFYAASSARKSPCATGAFLCSLSGCPVRARPAVSRGDKCSLRNSKSAQTLRLTEEENNVQEATTRCLHRRQDQGIAQNSTGDRTRRRNSAFEFPVDDLLGDGEGPSRASARTRGCPGRTSRRVSSPMPGGLRAGPPGRHRSGAARQSYDGR